MFLMELIGICLLFQGGKKYLEPELLKYRTMSPEILIVDNNTMKLTLNLAELNKVLSQFLKPSTT